VVTTITGTVFDPAGKLPLYNAVVYVPNAEVPPLPAGASCDRCAAAVNNPVVSALTDTQGRFVLSDVPVGADVPLVIQLGKWRRQIKVPSVAACLENALTDPELTRLPRNQSEGEIPLIAITTGGADSLECLPRRLGIDDSEITTETGAGRIHLYSGADSEVGDTATKAFDVSLNAGATLTRSTELWSNPDALARYDMVLLSCEGRTIEQEKPMTSREALYGYTSIGGRVMASHWHHIWFSQGPEPVPQIGTWQDRVEPDDPAVGIIDTSFPKGEALADWLFNVQASTTRGAISINSPRDNIQAVNPVYARQWITTENTNADGATDAVQYLSFNAPLTVPEEEKCGRAVFTDLHVSSTGADVPGEPFPLGCEDRDLSAEEKALAFMLFDLSSCIQDDDDPPVPPPK
jgi:hypothetical protein